ncbi:MAG: sulfatase-like hydrolase/transferase [Planctomycetes bacterium]|nr:sulfatase-like hydrolase/transferase [Planctomycetota bacterium]
MVAARLLLALAALAAEPPAPPAPPRPNIVLIFADDLGYGELGCQGNPQIPTPHIDSLARNGVRFTSGYVTASYCSPSRAGILTGRYQTRFGHELNPVGQNNLDPRAGLPLAERTIAQHLRDAGYATAIFGKWHLGGTAAHHPQRRGFDAFFGFLHEGHFYVPPPYRGVTSFLRKKGLPPEAGGRLREGNTIWSSHTGGDEPPYDEGNPILRGATPVEESAYLTDAITREAVRFIERHKDRPFFLYLPYNAIHSPMQGPGPHMERFASFEDLHRRVFAAMLASLDDGVGAVLGKLRACGLEERTLVLFISDNGGPTRELTSSNAPLRGGKGTMYEGGIRVPFIIQWKGTLPAGATYDRPVSTIDVFATASAAARIPTPRDRPIDGMDLLPYVTGKKEGAPHETLYWRMGRIGALRKGDWKIVVLGLGIRAAPKVQLFDLGRDIGEAEDLAERMPERRDELLAAWRAIDSEMVEPAWVPGR